MDGPIKIAIFTFFYAVVFLYITYTVGKRTRLNELNKDMSRLMKDLKKLGEGKENKKKKEKIEQEVSGLSQEMLSITSKQMIYMIPLLFGYLFLINHIAPSSTDDLRGQMLRLNDTNDTYYFESQIAVSDIDNLLYPGKEGTWMAEIDADNNKNFTKFYYISKTQGDPLYEDIFKKKEKGFVEVWTDKEIYQKGETMTTYARGNFTSIAVTIDRGSRIYMRLPFSLPIIGNTLGGVGLFIVCSLVFSSIISKIYEKYVFVKKEQKTMNVESK